MGLAHLTGRCYGQILRTWALPTLSGNRGFAPYGLSGKIALRIAANLTPDCETRSKASGRQAS